MRHLSAPPAAAPGQSKSDATLVSTGQRLWPYIWPRDRFDLKLRIFLAFAALVVAKLVTIAVPYSFKWATDSLNSGSAHI
ncbi:MAG: metal ABC transporter permease, partial [Rhodoblastus sp.]|nr:metal ABC transporter permease [Rhodoblastus sp.]